MIKRFSNSALWIIGLNVIIFLATAVLFFIKPGIAPYLAFSPNNLLHGMYIWTLVTSMFIHANLGHLVVNMLSLVFLGSFVERLIGSKRFLAIYFISGIMGCLVFALFALSPFNKIPGLGISMETMAVGASGAIFGLAGMLAVLTPKLPVYIMFIPIEMPLWIGVSLMMLLFTILTAIAKLPIGNAAHLGGLLAGIAYALYLRHKHKRKARIISNFYR